MKKSAIALAVATAMGASAANAAAWNLTTYITKSSNGQSAGVLAGDTSFVTGVGNSLVSNGAFSAAFSVGVTPLMTQAWGAGTTMSGGGTVSGSFNCLEGLFGGYVGASICGNYNFGGNYANESTVNTDGSNRVIGGDDMSIGPAQSVADFTGFAPVFPDSDFVTTIRLESGTANSGNIWEFTAVPVPAAAWLFGSALGLLGWARRRTTS